jgi:hypothetical protein
MEEIEQILKTEVEKYINKNPYKNDKTISGLANRLKYIKDNAEEVTKKVNALSNEYLAKYPYTDVKELTDIASNIVQRFLVSPVNG